VALQVEVDQLDQRQLGHGGGLAEQHGLDVLAVVGERG